MSSNNYIEEQVSRFVCGEMSGEELADFESQMAGDVTLQAAVDEAKFMNDLFLDKEAIDLKEMMKADLNNPKPKNGKKWMLGSGLLVILAATALFVYPEDDVVVEPANDIEVLTSNEVSVTENKELHSENKTAKKETKKKVSTFKFRTAEVVHEDHSEIVVVANNIVEEKVDESAVKETVKKEEAVVEPVIEKDNKELVAEVKTKVNVCDGVQIHGGFGVANTFSDRENGVLDTEQGEIEGGTSPYLFSLDGEYYSDEIYRDDLAKGEYAVYIKDDVGCTATIQVTINSTSCYSDYQKTFDLASESEWTIPVVVNQEPEVQLVDKFGTVLLSRTIASEEQQIFDGYTNNGNKLTPNSYSWMVKYANDEQCIIKMTILN